MVPDSEQTVSFLLRLHYLDAAELTTQLGQYILPGNNNGFTPLQKSGAVIITETASSVRRLVNLITQLDAPAAPVVEKVLRAGTRRRQQGGRISQQRLRDQEQRRKRQPAGPRGTGCHRRGQPPHDPAHQRRRPARRRAGHAADPGQLPGAGRAQRRLHYPGPHHADARYPHQPHPRRHQSGQHAAGRKAGGRLRRQHALCLAGAPALALRERARRAADSHPGALTEPGPDNNGGTTGGDHSVAPPQPFPADNNVATAISSNQLNSIRLRQRQRQRLRVRPRQTRNSTPSRWTRRPTEATVGTTKIIADPRSNTIILLGSAEAQDKVSKVLDQLDIRAPQVVIRVVIGELSLGNNTEFGSNYLLQPQPGLPGEQLHSTAAFPGGHAVATPTTAPTRTGPPRPRPAPPRPRLPPRPRQPHPLAAGLPTGFTGLAGIISVTKGFDIILSALEATNRFKTINRPVLFTQNNKKADIISGQEIAVPTNSLSTATTTVGSAGIADQRRVQDRGAPAGGRAADQQRPGGHTGYRAKARQRGAGPKRRSAARSSDHRQARTEVDRLHANGATVVLGGLITLERQKTDGNIPILSKIPLVGLLFQTRTRNSRARIDHSHPPGSDEHADGAGRAARARKTALVPRKATWKIRSSRSPRKAKPVTRHTGGNPHEDHDHHGKRAIPSC